MESFIEQAVFNTYTRWGRRDLSSRKRQMSMMKVAAPARRDAVNEPSERPCFSRTFPKDASIALTVDVGLVILEGLCL